MKILLFLGQGKSDEIPSLILLLGFAFKIYSNECNKQQDYKNYKQLWIL